MASSLTSSSRRASVDLQGRAPSGVLPQRFYERDTVEVARELLGKLLVVRGGPRGSETSGRIVETEAYHGEDPAAHCARGETPRCKIMFGEPGLAYVYFIYGNYEMLNIVTERKGYPGAVLIRAVAPVQGLELMRRRRGLKGKDSKLTSGPGKLCRAMGVKLSHNGQPMWGPKLCVIDDGFRPEAIRVSPRVGIRVGTEAPWRFYVDGDEFVSKAPQNRQSWVWVGQ